MSEKMVSFEGQKSEALGIGTSASLLVKILQKFNNMNEDQIRPEDFLNPKFKEDALASISQRGTPALSPYKVIENPEKRVLLAPISQ